MLTPGHYRSPTGSEVEIFGKHGKAWRIDFDWFEEGACTEAAPDVDIAEGLLTWNCECCRDGYGSVPLLPSAPQKE